jgi:TonB family protein
MSVVGGGDDRSRGAEILPDQVLLSEPRESYQLGWAFSLSTWIHVLALVLVLYLPSIAKKPAEPKKDDVVAVDMAQSFKPLRRQEPQPPVLRRSPPKAPQPAPQPPASPPRQPPAPVPPGASPDITRPPQPGGASEPQTTPQNRNLPRTSPGPPGAPGPDREPPPGVDRGDGGQRRLSLDQALKDFTRALPAPGEPGGGGKGRGGSSGKDGLQLPGLPPSGFGFGNLEFEGRDYDWTSYATQIYFAILRAWYSRLYATATVFERWAYERGSWLLDHNNRIRFTIEKNGQVTGVTIETPSGCVPLDDSAVDALREVVLPPLPEDFRRTDETVRVRFIAYGDIRNIRDDPQLRAAYYGR